MENFIVSARKYRPQTFDTVVGQKSITNTLKNAIRSNHLAQAFLFCGPRGVGKTTCARILAKTINCQNLSENIEACDECESCKSFNRSASFNIHELDAASNNSVDDIRNLVDQVRIPPQVGKYKVYIIDEVHMLSQAAFNAFLKTLEEPPAYAKFILATTEKHKIIPTILSRCQIYDFRRITIEDITGHLVYVAQQEDVEAEQDALHVIAQKSDGALRDALSIFDQIISFSGRHITYKNVIENLNVLDYDYYFRIVEALLAHDISQTLLIINEIIDNGFDGQHFLTGFAEHLRNLLVCKDSATIELLEVGGKLKGRYGEQSRSCSVDFLIHALDVSNKCDLDYKISNHKKIHLELALIQISTYGAEGRMTKGNTPPVSVNKPKEQSKEQSSGYIKPESEKKPAEPVIVPVSKPTATAKVSKQSPVPGTISIKNKMEEPTRQNDSDEDLSNKPADEFTNEQLESAWLKMANDFLSDKNFFITLTKYKPVLKDGNQVEFTVDNKVQKEDIIERKLELLPTLRKELNNFHFQFEVLVNEQQSQNKAYFPREKFENMAKKNPALKKMKDQLNLEIE
ncbi:MAG: DNA polymerase III subunit gamma/tau [Bacteroidales bacterium]|nr:DNA polymerase III subunit gamma/tau [Bacteroidales bacterium]